MLPVFIDPSCSAEHHSLGALTAVAVASYWRLESESTTSEAAFLGLAESVFFCFQSIAPLSVSCSHFLFFSEPTLMTSLSELPLDPVSR